MERVMRAVLFGLVFFAGTFVGATIPKTPPTADYSSVQPTAVDISGVQTRQTRAEPYHPPRIERDGSSVVVDFGTTEVSLQKELFLQFAMEAESVRQEIMDELLNK